MNHLLSSRWSDEEYWRRLCPHLSITSSDGRTHLAAAEHSQKDDASDKELLERLIDDGYALIDSPCSTILRESVCQGISDLELKHSLPATFILLFDETWRLAAESQHRLPLRHKNMCFNFDMLAWHIDARRKQVGFSPHRDRQPDTLDALKDSFYPDGQAKYITHWIALAEANPNNSCLYVIPKQFDPGYLEGDDNLPESSNNEADNGNSSECIADDNKSYSDPLSRALPTKQSYQNIRALPRKAGESIIFTHRILHWGSAGNPNISNLQPRVAISFVYSDVDFEAPYLTNFSMNVEEDRDEKKIPSGTYKLSLPSFKLRLLLVCSQLLIYYQRFNLSTQHLRACYDYCKQHADELNETYRTKVFVEFVKAMKESRDGAGDDCNNNNTTLAQEKNTANNNEEDDSDDEEAMLEAMLDNSEEFEDDYDDAEYDRDNVIKQKRARVG